MQFSLAEALDNLNALIEASSLEELEILDDKLICHLHEDPYFIEAKLDESTLTIINQTFETIYKHLLRYYEYYSAKDPKRLLDNITTIMLIVGEAAKKLESFDVLFKQKVLGSKPYQDLQEFYRTRVAKDYSKRITKSKKRGEILPFIPNQKREHTLLNDIGLVKQDLHYELLYMQNELGHPFYNQDLVKKMKINCDFTLVEKQLYTQDPLLQLKNWEDRSWMLFAQQLLDQHQKVIESYLVESKPHGSSKLVKQINSMLIALGLGAKEPNLMRQFGKKACFLYFQDFLFFLRQVQEDSDFKKALAYLEKDPFLELCVELIADLTFFVHTNPINTEEIQSQLFDQVNEKTIKSLLKNNYLDLTHRLSQHPSGPLFKAVDAIYEQAYLEGFDPWLERNIAYPLYQSNSKIHFLHLPCPTHQSNIDHASFNDEFFLFLHKLEWERQTLLLFNFQNQKSWEDKARCDALQRISKRAELKHFYFVTLPKIQDYLDHIEQSDDFLKDSHAFFLYSKHAFYNPTLKQYAEQAFDIACATLKQLDLEKIIDQAIVFYPLYVCALIDQVRSVYVSFCSKDGLDDTLPFLLAPWIFRYGELQKEEAKWINWLFFGPTLIQRERVPFQKILDINLHLATLVNPLRRELILQQIPWLGENLTKP